MVMLDHTITQAVHMHLPAITLLPTQLPAIITMCIVITAGSAIDSNVLA